MWNSLPDVAVNASTVNQFKNNLDKHLRNQEIMYDYKAELSGVLSRSNNITDYQPGYIYVYILNALIVQYSCLKHFN